MFSIVMVNGAFESGLIQVMEIFFAVGSRDDHKQVESSEKGNSSELPDSFLKASTADHQGRLTEI